MRPQLARILLGLALAVSVAGVSIAATPESAKAVSTSYVWKQVKSIKSQITSIKAINAAQDGAIAWLQAQINSLQAQINSLKSALAGNDAADATQASDIAALKAQVDTLSNRLRSAETTIAALEAASGTTATY